MQDERQATPGSGKSLERVPQFAASGRFALKFPTPRRVPGKPLWPAFECQPPVTNWSGFDRLAFTVVNPDEHPRMMALFISDSKVPTRQGLSYQLRLAPFSYTPAVVPRARGGDRKLRCFPVDHRETLASAARGAVNHILRPYCHAYEKHERSLGSQKSHFFPFLREAGLAHNARVRPRRG